MRRSRNVPLDRSGIITRLGAERTLWLVTNGADGTPHAAPVWCAVARGTLCVFSYRPSAKARNLFRDPRVTLHTEDGEDVMIVHGRMRDLGSPADCPDLVEAFAAAYPDPRDTNFLPGVDPAVDVLFALDPKRALAWRLADFEGSQERWHV
jgi:nitroimidazol reductase NimA-like FMN-containing flavoprotein (pyridoxamine 5'-phosphate oxidase superfamily)